MKKNRDEKSHDTVPLRKRGIADIELYSSYSTVDTSYVLSLATFRNIQCTFYWAYTARICRTNKTAATNHRDKYISRLCTYVRRYTALIGLVYYRQRWRAVLGSSGARTGSSARQPDIVKLEASKLHSRNTGIQPFFQLFKKKVVNLTDI
jgi:hypothetical protein